MKQFFSKFLCVCETEEKVTVDPSSLNNSSHYSMTKPQQRKPNLISLLNEINLNNKDLYIMVNKDNSTLLLVQRTNKIYKFLENDYRINHRNIFDCYYEKQLIYDFTWKHIVPQQVAKYIAQRCNGVFQLLEINSQFCQHSIQFAKAGIQVTAINADVAQIQQGLRNIQSYNQLDRVDLLNLNFETYHFCSKPEYDGVFINLCGYHQRQQQKIYNIIQKSLQISQNLVILMHYKSIDFLLNIFTEFRCLEKESIIINDVHEFTIIYLGQFFRIDEPQICYVVKNSLPMNNYQQYDLTASIGSILAEVCSTFGTQVLMRQYFNALQQIDHIDQLQHALLKELEEKDILTQERLLQIHMNTAKSPSVYYPSMQNHPSTGNKLIKKTSISSDECASFSLNFSFPKVETKQSVFDPSTLQTVNNNE